VDLEMTISDDELIVAWGERLFYRPVQSRPNKRNSSGLLIAVAIASRTGKTRAQRVRRLTVLTTRKAPEVMVKISGSSRGMNKVRAHLEYISRNGKVELENETREKINSREGVRDLCDEWKNGLYGIPIEGVKRESFNIVLSMPPGTDRSSVKSAAAEFAHHQFGENHQFVFAAHDDERHPHVHLCVKSLGFDGTRLNPRKADLQHWREQFAEHLRQHGVEANATPRFARGQNKQPVRQKDIHMAIRGGIRDRISIRSPAALGARLKAATQAYEGLAKTLARTGERIDRQLAVSIVKFVGEMHGIDESRTPKKGIQKGVGNLSVRKPGGALDGPERE
jgi:hypothetical protein